MATIRQRSAGSWEIIIRRKDVLDKPHYASADTKEQAQAYAKYIENLLDQGIIPEFLLKKDEGKPLTVRAWIRLYLHEVHCSESDKTLLNILLEKAEKWPITGLNMAWANTWVGDMKRSQKLAPGSIRKRVGAVARMLDWYVMRNDIEFNPLRQLPKNYAQYAPADGERRIDVERDRRLQPGEFEKFMEVFDTRHDLTDIKAWRVMFIIALGTGMRLREIYTLSTAQIDLKNRTIYLFKTKTGKKRQIPLSSVVMAELEAWKPQENGLLFPFWDGKTESLRLVTMKLSSKWRRIAKAAGCDDFTFHDIRHEAASSFYENTGLSDVQIAKILGHSDTRMLVKRYANLRGSDLADYLD